MKVKIEVYQDAWKDYFLKEQQILSNTLADLALSIDHIGSTAVEGLGAKSTIDILIGIGSETDLDKSIAPMIHAGYTYFKIYEPRMPYRRLFSRLMPLTDQKPPGIIDVNDVYRSGVDYKSEANIHIIVKDTHHWTRHIAFRDYLRTHPSKRDEYFELKNNLSHREYAHQGEYSDAKDSFIKETEKLALIWFHDTGNVRIE